MTAAVVLTDDRRAASAAAVLRGVLVYGPIARSGLARLTGLSPAGVTRLCATLTELGLLTETATPTTRLGVGRPHIPLDIDTETHIACGIHIAHEYSTVAAVDLRGRVRAQRRLPHAATDPERLLASVARHLRAFVVEELPGRTPFALGVATGGWVDPDAGVVVDHASLEWRDVPVREVLTRHSGLPVQVDSHARALAQAERLFGQARAGASVVHLFVGNVVDAAFVTGGIAHRGPRSGAGEIAHLPLGDTAIRCACGRFGCFETTVSDWAWARRAVAERILPEASLTDLVEAARAGSGPARRLLVDRAKLVGRAAAMLFDVINPEVLVVTELGVITFPECLDAVRAEVARRSYVCPNPGSAVLASSFAGSSVLGVAAGAVPLESVYRDPLALRSNPRVKARLSTRG